MTLIVCKLQRLSKMYVQTLLILCCQEFFVVLKYIGFKRKSGVSTGSTFSALTVKREIQKKTAFRSGTPLLLSDHAISSWLYVSLIRACMNFNQFDHQLVYMGPRICVV